MKSIFLIYAILFVSFSLKGQSLDVTSIRKELDYSNVLKAHFFGFCLYDLDSNRFVMGVNENKLFTPASNAKTFTLFASLKNLGDSIPGLHYVERGDSLIFWGTGDPTFLHNRLDSRKVFDFLKTSKKRLYYAAEQQAEETFFRKGWAMEDYEEYYQPEISSFPIFGNVVTFREKKGVLTCSPARFQSAIEYRADANANYALSRRFTENVYEQNRTSPPHKYVNEKPFRYSPQLFVQLLTDTLKRDVKLIAYNRPTDFKTIYSQATAYLLREMMLPSDNFIAEQLNMLIAQEKYASFQTARLRNDMQKEYYDYFTDKIELYDGSGLSSYNKVTPRSMVELLSLIHNSIKDSTALHRLFPTGGVDGTLKRAYALDKGEPFVWAKTGTVHAVHNQSGFIRTRKGRNFAFSFLNTNFWGEATAVRREMVRIMTFIRENY
ncbi:D-alanyl-D-alanine carboxypeptidase [Sphingobacterium bambusae]|uniref:D-alanyl-D-alanine carboxypeptidase n=1 Tax=Sphingobacterium bambusae TaxID=662858 RepID=A0ABW6BF12_9SPHI|nr:D-alanyl-D-alanine carboxypeptidase [Sphingobacterium bambusae]WPL48701.1 D-alanyl-D-alanine carboxypeptidase [Sphingobacterium bambusae]